MADQEDSNDHLTPDELAKRWHLHRGTLAAWRSAGTGPAYIKLGKSVLYPTQAIEDYERKNTVN